ncbi:archease [Methanohalophilus sp. RSK]|uniref:archease n=1 Tax=Methanohalophilus sp. RSK TaxID=2485783 RepID=UPI000F43998A|nr:archease [Methanohalophilus sp. RSK]RNI13828.1 archease [Methanohalophilus sp. RSK]
MKKYEYIEHTADARFKAFGKTAEEAFANAAQAMFNVMIDTSGINPQITEYIELQAPDLENLLVDWLSELLYLFEVNMVVFSSFEVFAIEKEGDEYLLSAKAEGEPLDLKKHIFDTEVKAVTYNDLGVQITSQGVTVRITVDT